MSRYGTPDGKWAKVEIMGHREHVARCLEVPLLDGKALRVCDETESGPIFYGIGAIFSIRWLTDEEGVALSEKLTADVEERKKRQARDIFIGGIQQTIRDLLPEGKKMTADELWAPVKVAHPSATEEDMADALDGCYLDTGRNEDGTTFYWSDPENNPF